MIMKVLFGPDVLYRYIRIGRLEDMLSGDCIGMLNPSKWEEEDPFEGFLFKKYIDRWPDSNHRDLKNSIYCLCFSTDMEKDQIWKSYTPKKDGVRIKIKVEDLKKNFDDSFVLDDVKYKNRKTMREILEDLLKQENQNEESLRNLFFYKFLGFKNDKEVRLLTIDRSNSGDVKNVHIDVCSVIKKIMFDPRMSLKDYEYHKNTNQKTKK